MLENVEDVEFSLKLYARADNAWATGFDFDDVNVKDTLECTTDDKGMMGWKEGANVEAVETVVDVAAVDDGALVDGKVKTDT